MLQHWLRVMSETACTPEPPVWARGLRSMYITVLDAINTFRRGTLIGWVNSGYAGWGDHSRLTAPGLGAGDLQLQELFENDPLVMFTVAPLNKRDVQEYPPGGQPPVLSSAGRLVDPRRAAEVKFSVGATLRQDRNTESQADCAAAGVRPWPYDSSMSGRIGLRLEECDYALLCSHGFDWDLGDEGSMWYCARQFVAVHQGACVSPCAECAMPLLVSGGVPRWWSCKCSGVSSWRATHASANWRTTAGGSVPCAAALGMQRCMQVSSAGMTRQAGVVPGWCCGPWHPLLVGRWGLGRLWPVRKGVCPQAAKSAPPA